MYLSIYTDIRLTVCWHEYIYGFQANLQVSNGTHSLLFVINVCFIFLVPFRENLASKVDQEYLDQEVKKVLVEKLATLDHVVPWV